MQHVISNLLDGYEQGKVSRRQLVQGLAALVTASQAAPAAASTFKGLEWNHFAIRVTDIPRSRDFYRKHFGLPVVTESEGACFLGLGRHFLTLFRNKAPGLDHFCFAIENFQPDAVVEELKRQNLNPRRPQGTGRIYFRDPDGLEVQVSSVDHRP